MLFRSAEKYDVKNLYPSVVHEAGQEKALEMIGKYFVKSDSFWRGIGEIKNSGYIIQNEYVKFSAIAPPPLTKCCLPDGCRCTDVMLGRITPHECVLFGKSCTPQTPIGPCMASSEGTCGIYGGQL